MTRARLSALCSALALVGVSAPVALTGFQSDRILGYATAGGGVNTTSLVIRRPPIRGGTVTTAGSQFDAVGSWTENAPSGGSYTYTVNVKASGTWSASTRKMQETLVASIANYKYVSSVNGTWQFESTGSCLQDPWRFPVTCTGIQRSVKGPTGGSDDLLAAVPFPLSASGRLTAGEVDVVSLAEVVLPQANEIVKDPRSVVVKVQVHDANIVDKSGTLRVDVRPYGSADFPTQATIKDYLDKSVASNVGSLTQMTFDLSGRDKYDWQVSGQFGKRGGKRSSWVRFRTPKVMTSPSKILNIEGELGATPWSEVTVAPAGAVTAQPMQQFGSGWSGGAHLLWGPGGVGDTLTVTFQVAVAGTYAAELYMTRAPDYANLEVTLAGQSPALNFSGFAPKVMWSGPIQMGKFQLAAGPNTLSFRVTGKYQDSKGYRAGFDRLRLYPG